MLLRTLGAAGPPVSALGLGTGHLGGPEPSDAEVERLIHRALELGVTLLDTARGYGRSEERLGRALVGRRDGVILSTKVGYGIPGLPDWTGPTVSAGVDEALRRLCTDRIDVLHLHSCPLDVLRREDVLGALDAAVRGGKVGVAAYSGEGPALAWAAAQGPFGSIQLSVNVCDQRALAGPVVEAARRGLGVLAKRPLANAPWRFAARPAGHYAEVYWARLQALRLDARAHGLGWEELFARFAAFAPGVSAILVGTASLPHLEDAVRAVERGPLPDAVVAAVREAFAREDQGWDGQV
jgi:aryl-alcohol dehydrogenase-like predicted oxidoreductase